VHHTSVWGLEKPRDPPSNPPISIYCVPKNALVNSQASTHAVLRHFFPAQTAKGLTREGFCVSKCGARQPRKVCIVKLSHFSRGVHSSRRTCFWGRALRNVNSFRSKCALRNCLTPGFTHKLNPSLRQRCASQPRSKGVALPLLCIYLPKKVIIAPVEARESAWA
jgi:hypothetical protein